MNQKKDFSTLDLEIQLLQSWSKSDESNESYINNLLFRAHANKVGPLWAAVYEKNILIVEKLLQHGANPDFKYSTGQSPLWTAAFNGQADMVSLLLQYGANINEISNEVTPLFVSVCKNHIGASQVLLLNKADLNIRHQKNLASPLMAAAETGSEEMIEMLLRAKANPDEVDIYGRTALYLAREKNFPKIVGKLVECNAMPDIGQKWIEKKFIAWFKIVRILNPAQYRELDAIFIDEEGFCNGLSLLWLIRRKSGCYPIFLNALKYISEWDESLGTFKNNSELQQCFTDIVNAVIWLKGQHALLNNANQATPETLLNFIGNNSETHLLFQLGFVFKPEEFMGLLNEILLNEKMILLQFSKNKHGHAVALMRSNNKIRLYNPATSIGEVIFNSIFELVEQIHFDINQKTGNYLGISIFVMDDTDADAEWYKGIKTRFLDQVLIGRTKLNEINIKDEFGASSIALSAFANDETTIIKLISFNASLKSDNNEFSPFYAACERGNYSMVKMFFEAGADINQTFLQQTPLLIALKKGHAHIVDFLVQHKAIGFQNDEHYSRLFFHAISNRFLEIARILFNAGADINYIDENSSYSPLYMSAIRGFPDITEFLLNSGARNEAVFCKYSKRMATPLEIAIIFNQLSVVRKFWRYGVDFTQPGPLGTPIHLAQTCSPEILEFLKKRMDPNLFFYHKHPIESSEDSKMVYTPQ